MDDANQNNQYPLIKRLWPYLSIAVAIFAISVIIGLLVDPELSRATIGELKGALAPLASFSPFIFLIVIIINNTVKTLLAIVLGIFGGVPSLIFVGFNGLTIGIFITALQSEMELLNIIASLSPHGIIEIPMLIFSTSLGLLVGMEAIKFVIGRRSQLKATLRRSLILYAKWILPGLVIAAAIETFITPLAISSFTGQ